jgi:hypothetical protein
MKLITAEMIRVLIAAQTAALAWDAASERAALDALDTNLSRAARILGGMRQLAAINVSCTQQSIIDR